MQNTRVVNVSKYHYPNVVEYSENENKYTEKLEEYTGRYLLVCVDMHTYRMICLCTFKK